MKNILLTIIFIGFIFTAFAQTADLNGVTFGFGAGYTGSFDRTYSYSLTTDGANSLKLQPINKAAFVISSVVMVKLGKVAADQTTGAIISQSQTPQYNALKTKLTEAKKQSSDANGVLTHHLITTPDDTTDVAKMKKLSDTKGADLRQLQNTFNLSLHLQ